MTLSLATIHRLQTHRRTNGRVGSNSSTVTQVRSAKNRQWSHEFSNSVCSNHVD